MRMEFQVQRDLDNILTNIFYSLCFNHDADLYTVIIQTIPHDRTTDLYYAEMFPQIIPCPLYQEDIQICFASLNVCT